MAKQFDLKSGGSAAGEKDYKVGEFPIEFKVEKMVDPAFLYQKGMSSMPTGSTAETFRPMNQKYRSCLPTRKKEQEILSKKKERLPYVLEDSGRKKQTFVGNKRGAEEGRYVMFLMSGNDSFSVYPIKESYSFTPKITRKVYSFEEAEAEFSRGKGRRGYDSDDDEFGDSEDDEDQGDEIDFTERMSDDEDVLNGSDDNEDVANMIKGMEDKSDIEDDDDDENPAENPARPHPDEEAREPTDQDNTEQVVGDPLHPPESEDGKKEGEESKKRPAEGAAGGAEEPARKKPRTDGGPDDDDPDGKKWDRMIEEHVKKLLLKRGSMTAQRILKYFKKRHGLDDKKKKS